ncbi:TlpA family protein disulfide reductase [Kordia sp. YSTF-M3]|uniref:TlpA family protein disulfide reductase n=1 Tax=Kordia aestuariivivens TaxID=2759037 RepID=A0ABR7Q821_9FLAO|nr:TlpA disulfide reductase family protein [Kordia aestuariivivens]MBC8754700.1 TlpA family protein disulfide reductase [Kordia aestuariivivens]
MKKILLLVAAFAIFSCENEPEVPKDYVTLSGKIENKNSDSLFIHQGRTYSKTIKVNEDGTFKDTLKVNAGVYGFYDGSESSSLYLKNGYDITMSLNTKEFDESISYTGNGSESSNYIAQKALFEENLYPPSLFDMEEEAFKAETAIIHSKLVAFLDKNKNLDSTLLANEQKSLSTFQGAILKSYTSYKKQSKARIAQFAKFTGKPSPKFDFENHKGGNTTLKDLKGKYVYIDVWATWCGPCIREIPSLKKVEKTYHDKNIEFVSISVDDGRGFRGDAAAAKEGWKKMVTEKELGGVQLLSDKGWKSDFVQALEIRGIPRFILIGPDGNIVNADAPRPSSPKLIKLFNELKI